MGITVTKEAADVCQTSIDILRARCEKVLTENYPCHSTWFPDDFRPYAAGTSANEILDVVLFGGFFTRFLESGVWPDRPIRLWTVCEASRRVLLSVSGMSEAQIQAIPRSALFPEIRTRIRFSQVTEPFTLVFAGRISAQKNIEALVWTTYYLQKLHRLPASLHLFGDFDDQFHLDRGWREHQGYEALIRGMVESLDWDERPVFAGKLASDEWPQRAPPNPLFVNFSTYISEDFGVAQAQAQAAGWGSIVPDWGGYLDLPAQAAIRIPWILIGNSHDAPEMIRLKSRNLAALLAEKLAERSGRDFDVADDTRAPRPPEPISVEALDRHRRDLIQELGPDSHLIYRFGMDAFAGTDAGRRFFGKYRFLFSGRTNLSPMILLVPESKLDHVDFQAFCENAIDHFSKKGRAVILISTRALFTAEHIWEVSNAAGIMIPASSDRSKPMMEFLAKQLSPSAPILAVSFNQDEAREAEALRPFFRPVDRALFYDSAGMNLDEVLEGMFDPSNGESR